ncbi:substrate-binding domain-containing protein [Alphaproteobacteria bacterium]|nr:substrate-binding domain-containing protein [Alphaproteobacteria bacterium]
MKHKTFFVWLWLIIISSANIAQAAENPSIVVQSTTSTKNSGLYDYLLPKFTKETGIDVHVVAVGTGAAVRNAMNCDGDVLLVHSRQREEAFVASGYAPRRYELMYNDFVLIGPKSDPAKLAGGQDAVAALKAIADRGHSFISRGDDSGTHIKERALWQMATFDPTDHSGDWYREVGTGMGATINIAVGLGAYTLSDRATWLNFSNKNDFKILVERDKRLFNPYGIMRVSAEKCPNANIIQAQTFIDWLTADAGQKLIASYKINGKSLFFVHSNDYGAIKVK